MCQMLFTWNQKNQDSWMVVVRGGVAHKPKFYVYL